MEELTKFNIQKKPVSVLNSNVSKLQNCNFEISSSNPNKCKITLPAIAGYNAHTLKIPKFEKLSIFSQIQTCTP